MHLLVAARFEVPASGVIHYQLGGWGKQKEYADMIVGIQISVDYLNGLILAAVTTIALLTAIYSQPTVERELEGQQRYFYALFSLLVVGLIGITITGDIFNLYVFMEIAALSSYALLAYGKKRATMASFNYLIMGTMGACLYLLGVGFVFVKAGTQHRKPFADYSRLPVFLSGGVRWVCADHRRGLGQRWRSSRCTAG